ncbi:mucin-5AC-like [Homarus americanus]|uniref:mucin-5AC-like n=1 Tax=Homarus americanus TaxID=6706 RepID=UPI001C46375E|nr:mucin-5AC-like [Homarus americanus]
MSTIPGDSKQEPSTAGASSAGAAAWPFTAQADSPSLGSHEVPASGPFYDSLDESSQSLSDSLSCHKRRGSGALDSLASLNNFSDSLEDCSEGSDTTATLDSDTGSFYSVQSYRTTRPNDSVTSLISSDFHSETTLYDSAQSIQTLPSCSRSSFVSLDNPSGERDHPDTSRHRNSVCTHPDLSQCSIDRRGSEPCWGYTSCPDLSPIGYRRNKALLQNPGRLSPILTSHPTTNTLSPRGSPRLSPLRKRASMSTVDGTPSPSLPEDADKKKKGLMSSFRKSRKTGRKLRQQKKASEGGSASTGISVTSDAELDHLLDSESSAPNSPAPVKSDTIVGNKNQEKAEGLEMNLDSHQATHERLNGATTSPKGSAASSKTPSPVSTRIAKVDDSVKKTDEKEEKKKEKTKFGSFLVRKDKKIKIDSGSKSSIMSNASAASSVTTDASLANTDLGSTLDSPEMKADEKRDTVKADSDPSTAAAGTTNTEGATSEPADSQSPSFRSYISSVQFVKNWSVNAEIPQDKPVIEAKSKFSVDEAENKTTPKETKSTVETKKITTSPADSKPSTAEVTSKRRTTVTIVSKQTESPKLTHSSSPGVVLRRAMVFPTPLAPVPAVSPSQVTVRRAATNPTFNTSSSRSKSPTPVLPKRLSFENIISPLDKQPPAVERGVNTAPILTPPPLIVTPPEDDTKLTKTSPEGVSVEASPVVGPVAASGMATPPSSPEGHGRDARETPKGDRSGNERNPLMDSSGQTSGSWAGSSNDKREHLYKILVIGELGTGKTSIIKRYVHQFFSQHYRATIGVDFALKVLNWDNNTVIRLQLWDIAGQERFGNMTRVYYKEAVGAFVVFDVTRAQTFDAVAKWKTDLDTKVTLADGSPIPTVLLANKCDQPKEGVVNNPARMDDYCRERGFSGWFETSAKENINIDEASRFLVNKILNNEKQGMMMTESMDTDKFSVDGKTNPVDKTGCRC